MKKLIGSLALAALLAGAAFAEIGLSSWGRVIAAPIAGDGNINYAWLGTSWGGGTENSFRTGFNVFGSSENAGFVAEVKGENISANDQAYMWAKPWDWIEVKLGRFNEDTGRGNACFGSWDWIRSEATGKIGEDFTFDRSGKRQVQGIAVKITPIDGLWIVGTLDCLQGDWNNANHEWWTNYVTYGTGIKIGYRIPSVGEIKAQLAPKCYGNGSKYIDKDDWDGGNRSGIPDYANDKTGAGSKGYALINAAFDLTAVENLFISLGAYIPTDFKKEDLRVNLYGSYNLNPVTIHLAIGTHFVLDNDLIATGAKDEDISKFGIDIGAGVGVDLGAGFGLDADFRYSVLAGKKEGKDDIMSFMVGVKKNLSNGYIGIGFEGAGQNGVPAIRGDNKHGVFTWSVPVAISMGF